MMRTLSVVLVSVVVLLAAGCKRNAQPQETTNDAKTPDELVGKWDQYWAPLESNDETDYIKLSTYLVTRSNGRYVMSCAWASKTSRPSHGISNIRYDGELWTFNSDWGDLGVGQFELKRVSSQIFEGIVYLRGNRRSKNRWVKTE